ncbi:MAG: integrase core domain-containing protein [Chromatiales bacterium]
MASVFTAVCTVSSSKKWITAPRSPWQNPYVGRSIGSIRRDCLDHMIVFNEHHLKRILQRYFEYYHRWRTHLGPEMDMPQGRVVQIPDKGNIIEIADLGGLHPHYLRQAA